MVTSIQAAKHVCQHVKTLNTEAEFTLSSICTISVSSHSIPSTLETYRHLRNFENQSYFAHQWSQ